MKSGIYCIENRENAKIYVGSSKHINNRLIGHRRMLRKGTHDNEHLQNAFNKYGEESFEFYPLQRVEIPELLEREQYWIDKYKSANPKEGYNINPKANGSPMLNPETAKKVSEALKGHTPWNKGLKGSQIPWNKGKTNVYSEETKQKIGSAMRGKNHSEETKKRISENGKGIKKPKSEEHKRKISISKKGNKNMLGRKHSDETKKRMSEAAKKRIRKPMSEETKKKIGLANSIALLGKKHSAETKLKMSRTQKERLKK
jgi:group I intron endonuclease